MKTKKRQLRKAPIPVERCATFDEFWTRIQAVMESGSRRMIPLDEKNYILDVAKTIWGETQKCRTCEGSMRKMSLWIARNPERNQTIKKSVRRAIVMLFCFDCLYPKESQQVPMEQFFQRLVCFLPPKYRLSGVKQIIKALSLCMEKGKKHPLAKTVV